MKLRDYQENLVQRIRASYAAGKSAPLVVSPPGSGKTVLFSYIAKSIYEKNRRVLILAHREELLDQISQTLDFFHVPHGLDDRVQVASVFTVKRRLGRMGAFDLLIIDEAHHAAKGSTWHQVMEHFKSAKRLGVTATPLRLSGEPLSDSFDDLILGPSVRDLMNRKYLSDYKIFAPKGVDLSGIKIRAGDYSQGELGALMSQKKLCGDVVDHYLRLARGKRAVAYCVSIKHSESVLEELRAAGISASSIDGKLSKKERAQRVWDFRTGAIQVLTSVDVISEGFDLPAMEAGLMLRPTKSLSLWLQQASRVLRPHEGKEYAIILDHSGNVLEHGLPCEDREWSLAGRKRGLGLSERAQKISTCENCFRVVVRFPCEECGHSNKKKVFHRDYEADQAMRLEEVSRETFQKINLDEVYKLIAILDQKKKEYGFKEGWVYHQIKARYGSKIANQLLGYRFRRRRP